MDIKSTFANRLKELRIKKGLSQEDLGKEIGVSRGSISYYEKEERVPDVVILAAISKYFNVSTDYLLGLSETKSLDEDIQTTMRTTGLSETAVKVLNYLGGGEQREIFKEELDIVSFLLESEWVFVLDDFEPFTSLYNDYDEKYTLDIIRKIAKYFRSGELSPIEIPWVAEDGRILDFPKETLVYCGREMKFTDILRKVVFDDLVDTLKEGKKLFNKH